MKPGGHKAAEPSHYGHRCHQHTILSSRCILVMSADFWHIEGYIKMCSVFLDGSRGFSVFTWASLLSQCFSSMSTWPASDLSPRLLSPVHLCPGSLKNSNCQMSHKLSAHQKKGQKTGNCSGNREQWQHLANPIQSLWRKKTRLKITFHYQRFLDIWWWDITTRLTLWLQQS